MPCTVTEASPRDIQQWLERGEAVLVDVREPDEHAQERISGALNAPLSRIDSDLLATQAVAGRRLVLHCKSGRRSSDAARLLAATAPGDTKLVSMTGGIEAWKSENLPVERSARMPMISVMRQVQLVIGLGVLTGSALAWFIHPAFIAIPAFFGAGLTFAGATGTCALASILGHMPWNRLHSACAAPLPRV